MNEIEDSKIIENWRSYPEHYIADMPIQSPSATIEGITAAEKALQEIRDRSFSGRNAHLGKMINCAVCGLRHRQNERKCEQKIVTPAANTTKGILGAARFKGKRLKPRGKKDNKNE
jgi:hypothetical protein